MIDVRIEIINGGTLVLVTDGNKYYFSDDCGKTYIPLHDEKLRGE